MITYASVAGLVSQSTCETIQRRVHRDLEKKGKEILCADSEILCIETFALGRFSLFIGCDRWSRKIILTGVACTSKEDWDAGLHDAFFGARLACRRAWEGYYGKSTHPGQQSYHQVNLPMRTREYPAVRIVCSAEDPTGDPLPSALSDLPPAAREEETQSSLTRTEMHFLTELLWFTRTITSAITTAYPESCDASALKASLKHMFSRLVSQYGRVSLNRVTKDLQRCQEKS